MGTKNRSTKTAAGVFRCATMALIAMAIVSFASCRKKVTGVSLNKTTLSLIVGDVEQLIATVEPMDAKGKSVTWTSSNANAAIVDNNGNITARASGNAIITVTTNNGNKTATCEVTVTLDPFKDDGVILNGITWATRNVDAPEKFAATPESPGMLYQWGRNMGWSSTDPLENSDGSTTWDSSTCSDRYWYTANDPCPTGWRVPFDTELQSLIEIGCTATAQNGVKGIVFGIPPNAVFLPAAGYRTTPDGKLTDAGACYYWTQTQIDGNTAYGFGNTDIYKNKRAYGFSIRCVSTINDVG